GDEAERRNEQKLNQCRRQQRPTEKQGNRNEASSAMNPNHAKKTGMSKAWKSAPAHHGTPSAKTTNDIQYNDFLNPLNRARRRRVEQIRINRFFILFRRLAHTLKFKKLICDTANLHRKGQNTGA
ncbi:MAG: hypothetical protein IKL85_04560, partial [Lentisphaeria bacterium]|nr:hypothetical protein [Lentisphaeria bacterium]